MLDVKFVRENADVVRDAARRKGMDPSAVDKFLEVDKARRGFMQKLEGIRAEQKKAKNKEEGAALKKQFNEVWEESRMEELDKKFEELAARLPNVISPDTPPGASEAGNTEVFRRGEPKKFDFAPKDHVALGEALDILDFDRGAKVAGFRGYYVKNDGVLLEMGIMMYAMSKMAEKGYAPMIPPTLVKEFALFGTGYFKGKEYDAAVDEIYEIAGRDKESDGAASREKKFLVGTAEPPLLAYHAGEMLPLGKLPLRMSGFSQCYRSEIGSYGKDLKGLYRVHEFMKVEQVVLAEADIEKSNMLQEEMLAVSGEMHEELGLPYRRLAICAGDLGAGKYRQFDTEVWLPGMNRWAETGSASNFLDWQARRLGVKYADADGEKKFVYMLNSTALPTPRILIAILENCQTKEGKIEVPKVLQKYVGKAVIG